MRPSFTKIPHSLLALLFCIVVLFVVVPNTASAEHCGLDANGNPKPHDLYGGCETERLGFASTTPKPTPKPVPFVCVTTVGGFPIINLKGCFIEVTFTVLGAVSASLGIAAILFDTAVSFSVTGLAVFVEKIPGITVVWTVLRDLSNILILFALLFSAIGIILRTDKIVPRSVLAKIIIAAFLINFSMFFTKAIIDVGNVLTYQIYRTANGDSAVGPASNLSLKFIADLNPVNIYTKASTNPDVDPKNLESHILQQMFFGIILLMVSSFTFFVAAFMLFQRFFILIFLIATSPFGVVGTMIPQLNSRAKEWWSTLIGQVFFAPVFMLFLFITVKIIRDPLFIVGLNSSGINGTTGGIINWFDFSGSLIGFIQYMFVLFFINIGLVVAKSVAGKTGSGLTKWASGKAGSLTFGASAWAGRQTLGRVGESLATSAGVGRLAASKNPLYSGLGKGLSLAGNQMKSGSYDFRGTGPGASLADSLDAGKAGGKGGLTAARKARAEAIQGRAEKYAVNRGVAAQEANIADARQKFEAAQTAYNAAPLASAAKTAARIAQLKAQKDLETAKDALVEMKGGVRASKAREELTKASEALTSAQRKAADSHMKVIQIQEELIDAMNERIKVNPNDTDAQTKLTQLTRSLADYKATNLSNKPDLEAYIKAQKSYEGVKKAASSISTAEKRTIAEEYMSSMSQARRTAADELLKGKEKPEDSLTKALKQMMQSGGGGGGNQQQNNPPAAGAGNAGNTSAPQGGVPAPQTPPTP